MERWSRLLVSLTCLAVAGCATSVANIERDVRSIEQLECQAVLARDGAAIGRIWSEGFAVTNPMGVLIPRAAALARLTEGDVHYRSFTRDAELIRVLGDVVVTAGSETVVPLQGPQAGEAVPRRYTHVWKREAGTWRLSVRHASVVPGP